MSVQKTLFRSLVQYFVAAPYLFIDWWRLPWNLSRKSHPPGLLYKATSNAMLKKNGPQRQSPANAELLNGRREGTQRRKQCPFRNMKLKHPLKLSHPSARLPRRSHGSNAKSPDIMSRHSDPPALSSKPSGNATPRFLTHAMLVKSCAMSCSAPGGAKGVRASTNSKINTCERGSKR